MGALAHRPGSADSCLRCLPALLLLVLSSALRSPQGVAAQGLTAGGVVEEAFRSLRRIVGPCSPRSRGKVIHVFRETDIARRRNISSSTTVTLLLHRDISLSKGLLFDSAYSCTIFQGAYGRKHHLSYRGWDAPVLAVYGAGNVLMMGVGLQSGVKRGAPPCKSPVFQFGNTGKETCPALYISASYRIQYTRATVYGRIDMFRTVHSRIDHVSATMPRLSFAYGCGQAEWCNHGVIRVGECGVGPTMAESNNVISNNEVYGSWELITLYRGAIGVTVRNNFLHDYESIAIRCGADISFIMDCALSQVKNNYIYSTPGVRLTGDSGALYTDTHWYSPGNVFSCNYVIGGDHCYYLDLASSGVTVNGGVCAYTADGVKINTGKFNRVRSLVMVGVESSVSYVSCLFSVRDINCFHSPGKLWEKGRALFYNSRAINARFPWMRSICNPASGFFRGQTCNPPGSLPRSFTGGCSGMPYGNDVDYVIVQAHQGNLPKAFCDRLPGWARINRATYANVSLADAAFHSRSDFAVRPNSAVLKQRRGFVQCPRGSVGPRSVPLQYYYAHWNLPKPFVYKATYHLDFKKILLNWL